MDRYFDYCIIHVLSPSVRDVNGDWVENNEPVEIMRNCRAESNDGEGYITDADMKRIDYSWILYLPKISNATFPVGTKVDVFREGEKILTDTIKRHTKQFHNERIWL